MVPPAWDPVSKKSFVFGEKMSEKYFPPKHKSSNFHCAICSVYARQYWANLVTYNKFAYQGLSNHDLPDAFTVSKCSHCDKYTLWINEQINFPANINAENPNDDMPEDVKALYNESARILSISPRAAAALLRLGLQILLGSVGGKGKNINDDIKTIVATGVEAQTQKALDILRVFGNQGAHPGEINLNENPELVSSMYGLMNFITDRLISHKKKIDGMFDSLPEGIKDQIQKRDGDES